MASGAQASCARYEGIDVRHVHGDEGPNPRRRDRAPGKVAMAGQRRRTAALHLLLGGAGARRRAARGAPSRLRGGRAAPRSSAPFLARPLWPKTKGPTSRVRDAADVLLRDGRYASDRAGASASRRAHGLLASYVTPP